MPPNDTPSRAAIYARVSLDRTGEHASIDRQLSACRDLAMRRGWTVVEEYTDNSVSASKPEVDRPEYQRLLRDLEAGKRDAVVVWAPDRLTRQSRQMLDVIDLAMDKGFLITTVQGDLDLSSPQGRMFAQLAAQFAQMEAELKGERHRAANRQAIERGQSIGRHRPLGYTDAKRSAIEPVEAEAIRTAYEDLLNGQSLTDVARVWTLDPAIPTGTERTVRQQAIKARGAGDTAKADKLEQEAHALSKSESWTNQTVRQTLLNPALAGIVVYKGIEQPDIEAQWEPIVSRDQQQTLAAHLKQTSASNAQPSVKRGPDQTGKYLLTGILRCGHCGRTMHGETQGSRVRYVCGGSVMVPRCFASMNAATADKEVIKYVVSRLSMMTPDGFIDPANAQRHRELLESLESLEEARMEAIAYKGSPKTQAQWLQDLDAKEENARAELAEVVEGNVLAQLLTEVLPHRGRNEDGPGYRINLRATADNMRRVEAKWETLSFAQKRQVIAALGTYAHSPQGRGKPATVAIEPTDIDSTKVKQCRYSP